MKKLAIASAALVALSLPMMANATHFTLNSSKNYVQVSTAAPKTYTVVNGKKVYANSCYGFKFTGTGKATPLTIPGLSAELDIPDAAQLNDVFTWQNDFLLNNVNDSANATPVNTPVVPAVVIAGKVSAISGSKRTITWDAGSAANLQMSKALISYAKFFPQFLGNVELATTDPSGKPLTKPNYSFTVTMASKISVNEIAYVKSSQGACTSYATIKRFYTMP